MDVQEEEIMSEVGVITKCKTGKQLQSNRLLIYKNCEEGSDAEKLWFSYF